MQQLKPSKATVIENPIAKKYAVLFYNKSLGWQLYPAGLFNAPENALEDFLRDGVYEPWQNMDSLKILAYKVVEFELEVSF
jgi:hypothetical protein